MEGRCFKDTIQICSTFGQMRTYIAFYYRAPCSSQSPVRWEVAAASDWKFRSLLTSRWPSGIGSWALGGLWKVENNFSRGKNTCIFVDVVQVQGEGHAPSQHWLAQGVTHHLYRWDSHTYTYYTVYNLFREQCCTAGAGDRLMSRLRLLLLAKRQMMSRQFLQK